MISAGSRGAIPENVNWQVLDLVAQDVKAKAYLKELKAETEKRVKVAGGLKRLGEAEKLLEQARASEARARTAVEDATARAAEILDEAKADAEALMTKAREAEARASKVLADAEAKAQDLVSEANEMERSAVERERTISEREDRAIQAVGAANAERDRVVEQARRVKAAVEALIDG